MAGVTTSDACKAILHYVFWKQLEMIGSASCMRGEFRNVIDLFDESHVEPIVDRMTSLEEVSDVYCALEGRDVSGKFVKS